MTWPARSLLQVLCLCGAGIFEVLAQDATVTRTPEPIPPGTKGHTIDLDQLGTEAQKQYRGEDIGIFPVNDGALLRTVMQDLAGEVTTEGLWLSSTADEDQGKANRFSVRAIAVGREAGPLDDRGLPPFPPLKLPGRGTVRATKDIATWVRPGLVEEYMVSTDGVRQDFVVMERPPGSGEALSVTLEVTGALASQQSYGAMLKVTATGRELAYSRLKVTDASGAELTARLEVDCPGKLRVVVMDGGATYPVRIDPTFSDVDWVSLGGLRGADARVRALAADGNGNLYIGGEFKFIGTVSANHVAKWNGSGWSSLGSGTNSYVNALVVSGNDVYAGGLFTTAGGVTVNRIAKWDGSGWSALGSGMDLSVEALALIGTDLYAGGGFSTAGGTPASRIARWNGTGWSALGTGTDGTVSALAVSGTNLYAGGSFTTAGGPSASNIARWDGSNWSALGAGANGAVNALAVSGATLYAAGSFTTAGSGAASRIARWNGTSWSALGSGINNTVKALAVIGTNLYAGGGFFSAGGVAANNMARWNGSTWSALDTGTNSQVSALAVIGQDLYAGGPFTTAGTVSAGYLARWNGTTWSALGAGLDSYVNALVVDGNTLYAGGTFTVVGTVTVNRIAKWDGNSWSALGTGMNSGGVNALVTIGNDLYAGGNFLTAGGVAVNCVARWNGTAWSALGPGMNAEVKALAVRGTELYVGGSFSTAGGSAASKVAKWNGSTWSALGSGVDNTVNALAVSGSDLYVGGEFSSAGGAPAAHIAKWDGNAWSSLGTGTSGSVNALAMLEGELHAGGGFLTAGGATMNYIAKWDGSMWSALGSGMNGTVLALAVSGADLYAGGIFTMADGANANRIARWNGTTWSPLGSGMNNWVYALATDEYNHLFVGGTFLVAGNTVSPYIAEAYLAGAPDIVVEQTPGTPLVDGVGNVGFGTVAIGNTGTEMTFTITDPGVGDLVNLNLSKAGDNTGDFTVSPLSDTNVVAGSGSSTFTVTFAPTAGGTRNAVLRLYSNVSGTKNPFDIALTGTGVSTNANLSALQTSTGTLAPAFNNATLDYAVTVPHAMATIAFRPTVAEPHATVRVNGAAVTSGSLSSAISLAPGLNAIPIVVTAQDGTTTKNYTINVTRTIPDIAVELAGNDIPDGSVTPVDFGDAFTDGHKNLTFTLKNVGTENLSGLLIGKSGVHSAMFTVTAAPPSPTLAPGASSTFTVRFAPTGAGPKTATLQISNNDPDESPFDIPLTGNGVVAFHGTLSINSPPDSTILVNEGDGVVLIPIIRTGGTDGTVGFTVSTTNGTAALGQDFTATVALQSLPDGTTSLNVAVPILNVATAEPNETFAVKISAPTGGAALGVVRQVTVRIIDASVDETLPAVGLSAPANNSSFAETSGPSVSVTGTATDNKGVVDVQISLNSGPFISATLPGNSVHAPSVTYTGSVNPVPGANAISVKSIDAAGNESAVVSRTIIYAAMRNLTLNVTGPSGSGALASPYTGPYPKVVKQQIGKVYTITATASTTPAPGFVFDKWTISGGLVAADINVTPGALELPQLNYTFQEGLVLTAEFIPNSFAQVAGTYNGLVSSSATEPPTGGTVPSTRTEGFLSATVLKTGGFSGKLTMDGLVLNVAGVFDNDGDARFGTSRARTVAVSRPGKPSLILDLFLDLTPPPTGTGRLIGKVSQNYRTVITGVSEVDADRATVPADIAQYVPSGSSALYTAIIRPKDLTEQPDVLTLTDYPQGSSYANITVTKAGLVTFVGTLADGSTPVSLSSTLSKDGRCALFAQLYGKLGFLSGLVELDYTDPESDMAALSMQWSRPYQDAQHYPYGWPEVIKVDLSAARYSAPSGQSILLAPDGTQPPGPGDGLPDLLPTAGAGGNAALEFSGSFMTHVRKQLKIDAADRTTKIPTTDASFTLAITRSNGLISGTFTNADDGTKPSYKGMMYQKGASPGAFGWHLTTTPNVKTYDGQSGPVILLADP